MSRKRSYFAMLKGGYEPFKIWFRATYAIQGTIPVELKMKAQSIPDLISLSFSIVHHESAQNFPLSLSLASYTTCTCTTVGFNNRIRSHFQHVKLSVLKFSKFCSSTTIINIWYSRSNLGHNLQTRHISGGRSGRKGQLRHRVNVGLLSYGYRESISHKEYACFLLFLL